MDDAHLIGGREKRAIVIVDYDPTWPGRFEAERDRIAAALGERALRIEHVGSTSVPDLAAKPIIDIAVEVEPVDDPTDRTALESAGYQLRVNEPGHRLFRTPERDVHLHLWPPGEELERHLRFRDRLRADAADREAYETLKRDLARRDWDDMNAYADAKGELIEAILARAPRMH
jgi:GrpB-like predicted nucleotidyltransferase (UPF0157 family)